MIPTQKPAWEPLSEYQAFITYDTQAAAASALAPGAKNYVAQDDEKGWHDPLPDKPGVGKLHFDVKGVPHVLYLHVLIGESGDSGVLGSIGIPVEFAKRVNIKPTGEGTTNVPGTGKTVPVPLKGPLAPTQKLLRPRIMSPLKVRNLDVPLPEEEAQQATYALMGAVSALMAKVDKILLKFGIS